MNDTELAWQQLRELVFDVVADMSHDGEGNAVVPFGHIECLCRLAGFAGVDGVVHRLQGMQ
ncbi:hypothetical protein [Paraburkholderia dinghuensis]|uniref:Uncharacterized protein n=1 Tax=Paraburkholderia dinghuensis TaxID=2305225 RepID=A0A3N6MFB7_9BURK|nr:hypothetical protein [Paraburkholderia dinghuensis]RQH02724.1 hypothetical protein D1Y85_21565 [Paraburkholderia dinghuensis]